LRGHRRQSNSQTRRVIGAVPASDHVLALAVEAEIEIQTVFAAGGIARETHAGP